MKKRLESELISIAHRILKLKNKSEIDQLYKETQKLYETLAVLKFYQDNFEMVKSDIDETSLEDALSTFTQQSDTLKTEEKLESAFTPTAETTSEPQNVESSDALTEESENFVNEEEEPIIVGEIVLDEDEVEDESFEDNDIVSKEDQEDHEPQVEEKTFVPAFELSFDEENKDENGTENTAELEKPNSRQVTLDEIFGDNFAEPVFVKPNEVTTDKFISVFDDEKKQEEPKVVSLNDALSKSISIGLNDRIGFVKYLFDDSNEDYNRVLSQLNTFDNFQDAKKFINEMVKPDYDNWSGREDYAERFLEIIEKKFL